MDWDLGKQAAECRLQAAEFHRLAKKAWLPSNRRFYSEMADKYLRLAEGYERDLNVKQKVDRLKAFRAEQDERVQTWSEETLYEISI